MPGKKITQNARELQWDAGILMLCVLPEAYDGPVLDTGSCTR